MRTEKVGHFLCKHFRIRQPCVDVIHNVQCIAEISVRKSREDLSGKRLQMQQLSSAAYTLLVLGINVRLHLKQTEEGVEEAVAIGLGAADGLDEHLVEDAFDLVGSGDLLLSDGGDGLVGIRLPLEVECLLAADLDPLTE